MAASGYAIPENGCKIRRLAIVFTAIVDPGQQGCADRCPGNHTYFLVVLFPFLLILTANSVGGFRRYFQRYFRRYFQRPDTI